MMLDFDQLSAFLDSLPSIEKLRTRQVQFEIDGLMYTSTKLPTTQGLEVLPRWMLVAGQIVIQGKFGADALGAALERLISEGTVSMTRALLSNTFVNVLAGDPKGGSVISKFDDHFAGEYPHLIRVMLFVSRHNLTPTLGVH